MKIDDILRSVKNFEEDVTSLTAYFDGAIHSRTYKAHEALLEVDSLTVQQKDSLKQAVRCVEHELYRSAFVMAWTALADLLLEACVSQAPKVQKVRSSWKLEDKESLSEHTGDFAIIDALKEIGHISKSTRKSLHGLLHRRNQCAHPSSYYPTADEALGYIREAIGLVRVLGQ